MRTEYCGKLNLLHVNKLVTIYGWVNNFRNLGNLIFIDVRDNEGIIQVKFNIKEKKIFNIASKLRNEFCIKITGIIKLRDKKNQNKDKNTGKIELIPNKLIVINKSKPLPINISKENSEDLRLKYRYLDLRSEKMTRIIKIRSKIMYLIRKFMKKNNFLEIETPLLTKSTPEGARDYLIPSRIHKNKYYALPQSPQLFKQLFMISGLDKYYQIAKCFRDEDLRSDRQPEFTQIDIEASFITAKQIKKITEKMIKMLWKKIKNIKLKKFKKISYKKSLKLYGTSKPDLRIPIKIIDIKDIIEQSNLKKTQKNNRIAAISIPEGIKLTNKKINYYNSFLKKYNINKLFWIKIIKIEHQNNQIKTPLKNIISENILNNIINRTKAKNGDIIFFIDEKYDIATKALGKLRNKISKDLHLINQSLWKPIWITKFPLFKINSDYTISSMHHPFTAPLKNITIKKLKNKPNKIISNSYDMIINGYEIGGGSVRINNIKMQKTIFNILGINDKEQNEKFGFFLDALRYGTPTHAGIAFGLDRIVMLLGNTNNIRDTIAFPKTTKASCLLTGAPTNILNNNY
ncbi:aspartate--tRNA ligase [Candidatus Purcelliella pentastirinorum]|uniref:Aspartate--tRNA ligase n=1 Tax=Candidatus Purcelliella pentastirinorum TaxID=472834 RepID=A0AAX3N8G0_9ENTR|nr:aspartate--tRNA ligase [Candidatus Purcelliella pentastirinorum]WDI78731.1 aspartate--tRNA ligase [Candidatus Purcelliella pentastirinorum]